jgi:transcriptional antiterminator RfaH
VTTCESLGDALESVENFQGFWGAVRIKPRQETLAFNNLQRQGFECYMPLATREKLIGKKITSASAPLFPGYLFVNIKADQSWSPIRSTYGAIDLVKFGGVVAKVDPGLIREIKARESSLSAEPLFKTGDAVTVTSGAFAGLNAVYSNPCGEQRSFILIEILQTQSRLAVENQLLKKATA